MYVKCGERRPQYVIMSFCDPIEAVVAVRNIGVNVSTCQCVRCLHVRNYKPYKTTTQATSECLFVCVCVRWVIIQLQADIHYTLTHTHTRSNYLMGK